MTAMRALVLCGLQTLCGCTKESVEGDRAVYMYEWWVSVVVLVGGTIGTGVCLLAGKEDWRGWLGAVAIAALVLVLAITDLLPASLTTFFDRLPAGFRNP